MATRAENAELIKSKLGIGIDTAKSDPKADLLTHWAERLEADPEGVRKDILTWQLQDALDIELPSEKVTAEQLQGWLNALNGGADKEQLVTQVTDALQAAPAKPTPAPAAPAAEGHVTVQVIGRTAGYGGAFTDPISKRHIGTTPVAVPRTSFVAERLVSGELAEVQG